MFLTHRSYLLHLFCYIHEMIMLEGISRAHAVHAHHSEQDQLRLGC